MKIKTDAGWRAIDSPYDPVAEARRIAGNNNGKAKRVVALGAGSGFMVRELLSAGAEDILLITGSQEIAGKNLQRLSGQKIKKTAVTIIFSPDFNDQLRKYLKNHFSTSTEIKLIYHPRELRAFPGLFNPVSVYVDSLRSPVKSQADKQPQKVFFPAAGQIFEPEIYRELTSRGMDVISARPFSNRNIEHTQAWRIIHENRPDLVISTNNKGSDRGGMIPDACEFAGIPWATWFLDEPRFIVSESEVRNYGSLLLN